MQDHRKIFEWKGAVLLLVSLVVCLFLFYHWSQDFYYSLIGALFSAALVFGSYIILRVIFLASQRD